MEFVSRSALAFKPYTSVSTPDAVTQVNLFSLVMPQNGSVATSNCVQDIYKMNLP